MTSTTNTDFSTWIMPVIYHCLSKLLLIFIPTISNLSSPIFLLQLLSLPLPLSMAGCCPEPYGLLFSHCLCNMLKRASKGLINISVITLLKTHKSHINLYILLVCFCWVWNVCVDVVPILWMCVIHFIILNLIMYCRWIVFLYFYCSEASQLYKKHKYLSIPLSPFYIY